ncbi:hypothetical protein PGT21_022604 [Puccinia graminis f. sp. tritici]|uniref:Uncharacterized protein n=1 Tax=Puccinia graminis f. sp. tritici TaxID=56615 RepID=A0A5B0MPC9_PUCGR|nr:hypothetical protein PGT21_022604 [Puccinia graminis f. sp. tritici]
MSEAHYVILQVHLLLTPDTWTLANPNGKPWQMLTNIKEFPRRPIDGPIPSLMELVMIFTTTLTRTPANNITQWDLVDRQLEHIRRQSDNYKHAYARVVIRKDQEYFGTRELHEIDPNSVTLPSDEEIAEEMARAEGGPLRLGNFERRSSSVVDYIVIKLSASITPSADTIVAYRFSNNPDELSKTPGRPHPVKPPFASPRSLDDCPMPCLRAVMKTNRNLHYRPATLCGVNDPLDPARADKDRRDNWLDPVKGEKTFTLSCIDGAPLPELVNMLALASL